MSSQPPIGAVVNGREFARRLVDHYNFECEACSLENCTDFQNFINCFEFLADYVINEYDYYEPSEAQQGLIPIPEGYNEQ